MALTWLGDNAGRLKGWLKSHVHDDVTTMTAEKLTIAK